MGCKCSCSLPPLPGSLPFSKRRSTSVKALLVQGKFFKNYKLGEKLGEGAFGQVRAASKIGNDVEYAVKIIDCRKDGRDDNINQPFLKDARQEARLLRAIPQDNCNVVSLFDSFMEAPGLFYMVMERCYGSLTDRLFEMPKLREVDLSIMFRQMLLGVLACHEMLIVHRDIKLDNFLYGGEERRTVKLADFGLAAELGSKAGLLKGVSGTAPYMSPEMLGCKGYNQQTDIWSFAATVYIILFGDCPYSPKEPTPAAVKEAIINAYPPPTWARDPKLAKLYNQPPPRATDFCKYLLKRAPSERPSGFEALGHEFLSPDLVSAEEVVVETPLDGVRDLADRYNQKRDPTVQRNLDEILQRLNAARSHFGSMSSLSEGRDDTQANSEDSVNATSSRGAAAERSGESRIVTTGQKRVWTHSGVLSENSRGLAVFSNLLPVAHEEEEQDARAELLENVLEGRSGRPRGAPQEAPPPECSPQEKLSEKSPVELPETVSRPQAAPISPGEILDASPEEELPKALFSALPAAHDNCPHRPMQNDHSEGLPEGTPEREGSTAHQQASEDRVPLAAVLNQCGTLQ